MSEQTEPRHPLWRRLLRYAGFTLSGLAGLLLVLLLALIAINWNDEELTPEAQAWLIEPPNPVADADNAWLAMIAVGVEKQPGTVVGRQMLERQKRRPRPQPPEGPYSPELGPAWKTSSIDTGICNIRKNGPDILPRILAQQTELQKLIVQQRPVLARYYAAIALPGFYEESSPDWVAGIPFVPSGKAACLARIDLALRLIGSDKTADLLLAQHMRHWLTALQNNQTLMATMVASDHIHADQALLQGLLVKEPVAAKRLLQTLRSDLQAFTAQDESAIRQRLMMGELRFSRDMMKDYISDANTAITLSGKERGIEKWLIDVMFRRFFKPQASLNLLQKIRGAAGTESAAIEKDCDWYKPSAAYNPIGKVFLCIGDADYQQYFTRIRQTQDEAAKLLAQIQPAAEVSR